MIRSSPRQQRCLKNIISYILHLTSYIIRSIHVSINIIITILHPSYRMSSPSVVMYAEENKSPSYNHHIAMDQSYFTCSVITVITVIAVFITATIDIGSEGPRRRFLPSLPRLASWSPAGEVRSLAGKAQYPLRGTRGSL